MISESCPAIHPNGEVSRITTLKRIALMRALSSGAIEIITNESINFFFMDTVTAEIYTLISSSQ